MTTFGYSDSATVPTSSGNNPEENVEDQLRQHLADAMAESPSFDSRDNKGYFLRSLVSSKYMDGLARMTFFVPL